MAAQPGQSDIAGFAVADPDGTFLTLSPVEAEQLLTELHENVDWQPLSPTMQALRLQLEEWIG